MFYPCYYDNKLVKIEKHFKFKLQHKIILMPIAIIMFIFMICMVSIEYHIKELFQERFIDAVPGDLGFTALASLVYACASFAQIAAGHAVDKFSAKTLLIGLLCGQMIALPVMALTEGPTLFFAALFVFSFGIL